MKNPNKPNQALKRSSPLDLTAEQFRKIGYELVDNLSENMQTMAERPVNPHIDSEFLGGLCHQSPLPEVGESAEQVVKRASTLLRDFAVSTSHPGFLAYIMGAGSAISSLADFLATAINPPVTSFSTSPLAVSIEAQTIRWLADLIGFPSPCGGLFVSGGSIANLVALKAALHKIARTQTDTNQQQYRIYTSTQAHSSIVAAADICGLGEQAVCSIDTTATNQLDIDDLDRKIAEDRSHGYVPLMVVGLAGCTSLGIVDPLKEISAICEEEDLWFHIDGAYGAFAVLAPEAPTELAYLSLADSITLDPHKWLYVAADVGCLLTKDKDILFETFKQDGAYYSTDAAPESPIGTASLQYRDLGPQTTRSFRALKVRMSLEVAGREGYRNMISDDIQLSRYLYQIALEHPLLEACTNSLSITTFRFVPSAVHEKRAESQALLNRLNQDLLKVLQHNGDFFPSHTWHQGSYLIRVCIVNINTQQHHMNALIKRIVQIGTRLAQALLDTDEYKIQTGQGSAP